MFQSFLITKVGNFDNLLDLNGYNKKKESESSLEQAEKQLRQLIKNDIDEREQDKRNNQVKDKSKYLSDLQSIHLGDFINDLSKGCTIKKRIPIVSNKYSIRDYLPSEWLNKYKNSVSDGTFNAYISHLNKGDSYDYKIGNDIYDLFLSNPKGTIELLKQHLVDISVDAHSFKYYFNCILSYDYAVNGIRRVDRYLCNDPIFKAKIYEKYNKLFQNGFYNEIIANFILCFIIGSKANISSKELKYICLMIWFTEEEIINMLDNETYVYDLEELSIYIKYHYANYFYDSRLYDYSYKLVKEIKFEKKDNVFVSANMLLSKLLLFGRGCDQNIVEACNILKKCYSAITASSNILGFLKSENLLLLSKIYNGSFSSNNQPQNALCDSSGVSIPNKALAKKYYKEYKISSTTSTREIIFELEPAHLISNEEEQSFTHKIRMGVKDFSITGTFSNSDYCLSNSLGELKSSVFINSLNGYEIRDFTNESEITEAISALLIAGKRIVFSFLSKDQTANLNDCLLLLDRLYNLCLSHKDKTDEIINNIDIFIDSNFDFASTMIDASLSDMGEIFFRVYIYDYNREAAHNLLETVPFFLNDYNNQTFDHPQIVAIGCTELIYKLTKEITAIGCLSHQPSITVLDNRAQLFEYKLKNDCPGIYNSQNVKHIVPKFLDCDLSKFDFPKTIINKTNNELDSEIVSAFANGTYFVVDIGDDEENIMFATKLRGWLLQSSNSFSRVPTIVVKCQSRRNAYLVKRLTLLNKTHGYEFYNNYNIKCFGMIDEIYNYNYWLNDVYKFRAYKVHCYYSKGDSQSKINNSYYSFSYNRDSSKLQAISIIYELFDIGLIKSKKDLEVQHLIMIFNNWIKIPSNDMLIAQIEHNRWNGFMLSRGFQSATYEQVLSYAGQESGSDHKHLLCKLHPFICDFSNLTDEEDPEKVSVINLLTSKFPELNSPVNSTLMITSHIPDILNDKENEPQKENSANSER